MDAGLGALPVHLGENLGAENERIVHGTAAEIAQLSRPDLAVLLIENPRAANKNEPIRDEMLTRGKVPMTKEEIRCIALPSFGLEKLRYLRHRRRYRIRSRRSCQDGFRGHVYAVERNRKALSLSGKIRKLCGQQALQWFQEKRRRLWRVCRRGPGIYRRKRRKAFRDPCSSTSEESARPGGDHSHFSGNGGRGESCMERSGTGKRTWCRCP